MLWEWVWVVSTSWTSCVCNQPKWLREASSNLAKVQLHGLKGLKKWGGMGGTCWAILFIHWNIFHRGCVTTSDCESCLFQFCDIKRVQECVNRTDFTHWKWESESATERDLSSCQCLLISIHITLPSFQTSPLSSAFILFSYSDSSLFTTKNKTFSFVSGLSGNATPEQLAVPSGESWLLK